MEVMLHPRVRSYLKECGDRDRIITHLKELAVDPVNARPGVDVRKLRGRKHTLYRLRVGDHRFEYFIDEDRIWVDNAFRRGRGYR